MKAKTEDRADYQFGPRDTFVPRTTEDEDRIIAEALAILESRYKPGEFLASPETVKKFMRLHLADYKHEAFWVIYLNAQNQLLHIEEKFVGTLTNVNVYPREIVKSALRHNAAAVIFAHNHPSGSPEPSRADVTLTETLRTALAMVDIRVLDHIIVTAAASVSLAERGLL